MIHHYVTKYVLFIYIHNHFYFCIRTDQTCFNSYKCGITISILTQLFDFYRIYQ